MSPWVPIVRGWLSSRLERGADGIIRTKDHEAGLAYFGWLALTLEWPHDSASESKLMAHFLGSMIRETRLRTSNAPIPERDFGSWKTSELEEEIRSTKSLLGNTLSLAIAEERAGEVTAVGTALQRALRGEPFSDSRRSISQKRSQFLEMMQLVSMATGRINDFSVAFIQDTYRKAPANPPPKQSISHWLIETGSGSVQGSTN